VSFLLTNPEGEYQKLPSTSKRAMYRMQKKWQLKKSHIDISDQVNEWVGLQLLVGEVASICV
jgi:hypothetical protein